MKNKTKRKQAKYAKQQDLVVRSVPAGLISIRTHADG